MPPADPHDPLSRVLADWQVAPPRDPDFRPRVWARLGAGPLPWRSYARQHLAAVAGALALAVALGAVTGRETARARASADRAHLATMYVQTYDARAMSGHR